mmetsp:Transcript_2235/g.6668  ORF Transcript_2235/g.6668 Transcript_2235/m.6668 type:complete len:310 (+) Transcript_2235:304-1233(+)
MVAAFAVLANAVPRRASGRYANVARLCLSADSFRVSPAEKTVLDIRREAEFIAGHLPHSTSIPLCELEQRLLELPPPFQDSLTLVGGSLPDLQAAEELLVSRGWDPSERLLAATIAEHLSDVGRSVRRWRPNEFLEAVLQAYRWRLPSQGTAIDYGCGSGRDAVYLALQLQYWKVIGVDRHSKALDRAQSLAQRCGVEVELRCRDLRKSIDVTEKAHLIHGSRFLSRPLFEACRDEILADDGIFVWSTFLDTERPVAPPFRPSRRLGRDELLQLFSGDQFEVLHNSVGVLNTRGVDEAASFFACRKRRS